MNKSIAPFGGIYWDVIGNERKPITSNKIQFKKVWDMYEQVKKPKENKSNDVTQRSPRVVKKLTNENQTNIIQKMNNHEAVTMIKKLKERGSNLAEFKKWMTENKNGFTLAKDYKTWAAYTLITDVMKLVDEFKPTGSVSDKTVIDNKWNLPEQVEEEKEKDRDKLTKNEQIDEKDLRKLANAATLKKLGETYPRYGIEEIEQDGKNNLGVFRVTPEDPALADNGIIAKTLSINYTAYKLNKIGLNDKRVDEIAENVTQEGGLSIHGQLGYLDISAGDFTGFVAIYKAAQGKTLESELVGQGFDYKSGASRLGYAIGRLHISPDNKKNTTAGPKYLVHNDLNTTNIIMDDDKISLIDTEKMTLSDNVAIVANDVSDLVSAMALALRNQNVNKKVLSKFFMVGYGEALDDAGRGDTETLYQHINKHLGL